MADTPPSERMAMLNELATEAPAAQVPAVVKQERKPRAPVQPKLIYPTVVAAAIIRVAKQVGSIQKAGFNEFQKYKYARWEDINEKLAPLLLEHGLILNQNENELTIREDDKGSLLAIKYEFTLVHESSEYWPMAIDTGIARLRDQKGITDDKAGLKCHTQARKKYCIGLFSIRSDDSIDPDDDSEKTMRASAMRQAFEDFQQELKELVTPSEYDQWRKDNAERVNRTLRGGTWLNEFRTYFDNQREKAAIAVRKMPGYLDDEQEHDDGLDQS